MPFTVLPFSNSVWFYLSFSTDTYFHFLCVSLCFFHPSLPPALACVAAVLRSVHHGSVLLCVFDSHPLSFLSLTGLTARPEPDWTVTHLVTGENKPPVLDPLLKSQHY